MSTGKESDNFYDNFQRNLRSVEERLSLPKGFIVDAINKGDDWSLAMKAGAIVEGAINSALEEYWSSAIGDSSVSTTLNRWITKHSVNGANGKLELSKTLGIFTKSQLQSARRIFTIRNEFAHKASSATKSLHSVYQGLESGPKLEIFDEFIGKVDVLGSFPVEVKFRLAFGVDLLLFISNETVTR
ncbi:hypothetical protein N1037_05485 [Phaeobacter sp. G2]|nr:hypothetical protein N1037_05485 [Phaeobacter sp. G2]